MARIGMYGVFYSKAVVEDGVVTGYTGGVKMMGKAISASFDPSTPDDNPLYANNSVAENDSSGASGGTLTMVLDRLTMEAAADLYGLEVEDVTVTVDGKEVHGKALKYTGMEQSAPVGAAYLRMIQEDDARSHEVVLYRRVVFAMPSEDAKTKEAKVEWQTPEIEGNVYGMEGDGTNAWYQTAVFPTQAAAIAYIMQVLGEAPPRRGDGGERMKVTYIELLGQKHPMCFSLAASEALDEAFGGLDQMQEELQSGTVGRVAKAADTVLTILLKAGRVYASARGDELPEEIPCRPADLIDASSKESIRSIFSAISGDTEREVEMVPKKGEATPGP